MWLWQHMDHFEQGQLQTKSSHKSTPSNFVFMTADLSPSEARYMYMLLHEWDVCGNVRHTLMEVYAALQLLKLVRVAASGMMGAVCADVDGPGLITTSAITINPAELLPDTSVAAKASAGVTNPKAGTLLAAD